MTMLLRNLNFNLSRGAPLQQIRALESRLKDKLNSSRSKIFPPIKRGASLDVYLTTSGNGVSALPHIGPLSLASHTQ